MTEESYQQCRKVMQKINYLRGIITKAEGNVAKWTKIEDVHRRELREGQANGANKALQISLKKLNELRAKFAVMTFPDSNIKNEVVESAQCENCGARIAKGNTYCGECLCED